MRVRVRVQLHHGNAVHLEHLEGDDRSHRVPGEVGVVGREVLEVGLVEVVAALLLRRLLAPLELAEGRLLGVLRDAEEDVETVLELADRDLVLLEVMGALALLAHRETLGAVERRDHEALAEDQPLHLCHRALPSCVVKICCGTSDTLP